MITKINVPKTSIVIEIENKEIKIENMIGYDMKMVFRNQDAEPSLDENGDVFEPLYWLDIRVTPKTPTEYHTSLGVKREKSVTWPSFRSFLNSLKITSAISLTSAASRENCNEISDIIVRHFNYCDRMGRISRL